MVRAGDPDEGDDVLGELRVRRHELPRERDAERVADEVDLRRARVGLDGFDEAAEVDDVVVVRRSVAAVVEHGLVLGDVVGVLLRRRRRDRRAGVVVPEPVVGERVHLLQRVAGVVLELQHHAEPVLRVGLVAVHEDDGRVVELRAPLETAEAADPVTELLVLDGRKVGGEVRRRLRAGVESERRLARRVERGARGSSRRG